ncbi:MAG: WXG100 family type VII secretion target [Nocardiaceae bacterium]|nr:WXG100 family type VII secretion target [Nocardiaceae bacterium]
MAAFRVDLAHLDQITSQLAGLVDYIEAGLAELDQAVAAAEWTGDAAAAFTTAHREWTLGAKDLNDGIAAMRQAATRAHQSYSSATATNLANLGRA